MFLNNRYHDPTLGTFISVDPLVTITGEAYMYDSTNGSSEMGTLAVVRGGVG